uniref:Uncharacterized protein n=1 Tax=Brassica campestris TaxID=3711 RepID=M4D7H4_BRACM
MPFDAGKVACWRHHRSSPLLVLYVFWLLMMPPSWSPVTSPLEIARSLPSSVSIVRSSAHLYLVCFTMSQSRAFIASSTAHPSVAAFFAHPSAAASFAHPLIFASSTQPFIAVIPLDMCTNTVAAQVEDRLTGSAPPHLLDSMLQWQDLLASISSPSFRVISGQEIVSPLRRHGPPTSSLYIYALSPSNSCYYSTVSFTLPSRHIAEPHHSNTDYGLPNQCFRIHLVQSRDVVLSFDPLFLLPSRVGRDLIVYALLLMNTTVKFKQMRHFSTAITYCSGITHIFLPPNSFHLRQRSFEISVQAHPPHLSDT